MRMCVCTFIYACVCVFSICGYSDLLPRASRGLGGGGETVETRQAGWIMVTGGREESPSRPTPPEVNAKESQSLSIKQDPPGERQANELQIRSLLQDHNSDLIANFSF